MSRPSIGYAQRVVDNAAALADGLLRRGITLVPGGTDNHLVLVDVTGFGLTGRQAEAALLEAGIGSGRRPSRCPETGRCASEDGSGDGSGHAVDRAPRVAGSPWRGCPDVPAAVCVV